ncbi:MAG TPA: GNAT family N-acetyltransferase [Chitinispirillaceae bacterium]|nr:GNAT family N-acetyltransferase [Chitinispirillaceae bacterium]
MKPELPSKFIFRFIGPEEMLLISQIEAIEEWLEGKLSGKLRNGHKCMIALDGDTIAGFNLIGFDEFQIPLLRFSKHLHTGECFSEQITVHPDYRRYGIGTEIRQRVFSAMADAGYKRIYGGTQPCNHANKALSKKVGLREFAAIKNVNICGLRRITISRIKKQ